MTDRSCMRMIVTNNSLWVIDFTNMEFQRHPRNDSSRDTTWVAYDQTNWTPFVSFKQSECPEGISELEGRIRFTIGLSVNPDDWITSTFDPKDQ